MSAPLTPEEMRVIELLRQLQEISPEGAPTAARLTLRLGNGQLVGEALLSDKAVDAATAAVISVIAYAQQESDAPTVTPDEPPLNGIDPLLAADFAEYTIGLDVDHLMTLAVSDPTAALAQFDDITRDGEL